MCGPSGMSPLNLADFCLSLQPAPHPRCRDLPRPHLLSESFFMVKGAALFLQQGNSPQGPRSLQQPHKHAGDLPQHLQVMINLLRCEDRIKLAVRLESAWTDRVRYMVVVYSSGRQDTEENVLLGVDFSSKESTSCTIGMVLHLWSDTKIHLDGDGGFSVSTAGRMHVFKPVSVQAMWSALQILHKACEVARRYNYFPGGMALVWATYYESCIGSDQSCINEWNAMQDLESTRPDSPALFVDKPTEGERTERLIKAKLRSIMMSQDLENVTSKEIRNELEKQMNCNLKEFKEFIDNEMLLILGQMDKPSLIFDHLYLGSEWNASNLEELQGSGVDYILNVTREIDNFFPGLFAYHNIRVYDEETTDLLAHWNEAYHFINKAKKNHSKCLVHCKMGVSRSASTVIAYAMKEFGWPLEKAFNYVKQKRSIARPNAGFMRQLSEYEGILDASKQRHNKLWKQQTESSLPQGPDEVPGPGAFPMEGLEADLEARLVAPDSPKQPGLPDGAAPAGSAFPYCFRQLSDPLPNSSGHGGDFLQLEDLERDALLGGEARPLEAAPEPARRPQKGSGSCDKEVRKRLEFGAPRPASGSGAQVEEMERDESPGAERRARPLSLPLDSRLNPKENVNNNNSKRSCPEDFEHDAIFGILNKVKPSYQSCTDCMYPAPRAGPEAFGERCEKTLGPPAICTQPPLLPPPTPSPGDQASGKPRLLERPCSGPGTNPPGQAADPPEPPKEPQKGPAKPPALLKNCDKSPPGPEAPKEEPGSRKEARTAKDPRLLLFAKELAKPSASSYLMQHQESIIQLQKAGLVRKHTKELERLQGVPAEAARLEASIPEESPELPLSRGGPGPPASPPGPPASPPCPGEAALPLEGASQKSPGPTLLCRPDHTSSFSKDFLKTICYTPTSSSMSSNLTRSSSSDSIHSVRGKPGLVKQRTQEIETRLRLAGLTVSSPLKRSHSLAKLGSLNFSSEDLSSEADVATLVDAQDSKAGRASSSQEPPGSPPRPSGKLALGGLWAGRS